eukprot:scaffold5681_cov377-Prasinococcus_capsulatus_cf.AAC.5
MRQGRGIRTVAQDGQRKQARLFGARMGRCREWKQRKPCCRTSVRARCPSLGRQPTLTEHRKSQELGVHATRDMKRTGWRALQYMMAALPMPTNVQ